MLTRFVAGMALIAAIATTASALDAIDAKGKKIGEVVGHEVSFEIDSTQSTVIAKAGKQPYVIYMGRDELAGTHNLYYATPDCTGQPGIEMDPAYRWDVSIAPSGVCPQGKFWIMQRSKMSQIVAKSVYIARADYRGDSEIGCESVPDLTIWITPLQDVGNLNTAFKPPYSVR